MRLSRILFHKFHSNLKINSFLNDSIPVKPSRQTEKIARALNDVVIPNREPENEPVLQRRKSFTNPNRPSNNSVISQLAKIHDSDAPIHFNSFDPTTSTNTTDPFNEKIITQLRTLLAEGKIGTFKTFQKLTDYKLITQKDMDGLLLSVYKGIGIRTDNPTRRAAAIKAIFAAYEFCNVRKSYEYYQTALDFYAKQGDTSTVNKFLDEARESGLELPPKLVQWAQLKCATMDRDFETADIVFAAMKKRNFNGLKNDRVYSDYMWMLISVREKLIEVFDDLRVDAAKYGFEITCESYTPLMISYTTVGDYESAMYVVKEMQKQYVPFEKRITPYVLRTVIEIEGYEAAVEYLEKFTSGDFNRQNLEIGLEIAANVSMPPAKVYELFRAWGNDRRGISLASISNLIPAFKKSYKVNSISALMQRVSKKERLRITYPEFRALYVGFFRCAASTGDVEGFNTINSYFVDSGFYLRPGLVYELARAPLVQSSFLSDIYVSFNKEKVDLPGYKTEAARVAFENSLRMTNRVFNFLNVVDQDSEIVDLNRNREFYKDPKREEEQSMHVDEEESKESTNAVAYTKNEIMGELFLYAAVLGLEKEAKRILSTCSSLNLRLRKRYWIISSKLCGEDFKKYADDLRAVTH
ncbi:hypothetical protein HK098_001798 [Nowakowskiella sp. JEL0407]|nr:hypothetical protein HK098_001798 [Nowakowskiella sp. JEL0407]